MAPFLLVEEVGAPQRQREIGRLGAEGVTDPEIDLRVAVGLGLERCVVGLLGDSHDLEIAGPGPESVIEASAETRRGDAREIVAVGQFAAYIVREEPDIEVAVARVLEIPKTVSASPP